MFLLLVEYWSYALRHPDVRESFVERFGAFRDTVGRWVEDEAGRGGWELPLPPKDIALGLNALTYGMAMQYLPGGDDLPEDALEEMAVALMTGIREANIGARKPGRTREGRPESRPS
jgi:hypothetical protein